MSDWRKEKELCLTQLPQIVYYLQGVIDVHNHFAFTNEVCQSVKFFNLILAVYVKACVNIL
jgi:hypothetical protein